MGGIIADVNPGAACARATWSWDVMHVIPDDLVVRPETLDPDSAVSSDVEPFNGHVVAVVSPRRFRSSGRNDLGAPLSVRNKPYPRCGGAAHPCSDGACVGAGRHVHGGAWRNRKRRMLDRRPGMWRRAVIAVTACDRN